MKKTYKNPTLKVVKVQPAQVIATSIPQGADWTSGTANGRASRFSDDDDWDVRANRSSVWDDD